MENVRRYYKVLHNNPKNNDEQTFSFLLQQAMPDYNVKLLAAGGYSLTEAVLNFDRLKGKISDRDIIILGYADFYDVRHVVAPSRLRELEQWKRERQAVRQRGERPATVRIGRGAEVVLHQPQLGVTAGAVGEAVEQLGERFHSPSSSS
jgi:hypothetical protein